MKKLLFGLAIGTLTLASFSSCTKEYITQEVTETVLNGKSYYFPLSSSNWTRVENNIFKTTISVPDLDDLYFEDGAVSVAILFEGSDIFYNIPAEKIDGYGFTASYGVGKVIIETEDLLKENKAPGAMRVKVVLTDADPGN